VTIKLIGGNLDVTGKAWQATTVVALTFFAAPSLILAARRSPYRSGP
jgi:hypothetical protein